MVNENSHSASLIGHIILNAVQTHDRQVGVGTLALILKGSRDKDIFRRQLNNSPFFGGLLYCSVPDIEYMIKQLMQQGFIERHILNDFRYPIPVLQLGTVAFSSGFWKNTSDSCVNICQNPKTTRF